ncbi:MAG: nucleoside monophosphate kinase [Gammaproteobacteria bacterium]|nr:nucleoside monophosphate kinase [Gammaproteobacteria bacterium]
MTGGQGTQVEFICATLRDPQISTGDMLRAARSAGTPLGREADRYMSAGELVPDELIISLVKERITEEDCAGFGPTVVPDHPPGAGTRCGHPSTTCSRSTSRTRRSSTAAAVVDEDPGRVDHVDYNPPKTPGSMHIDWRTAGAARRRHRGDGPRRLEVHPDQTRPLVDFYSELAGQAEDLAYHRVPGGAADHRPAGCSEALSRSDGCRSFAPIAVVRAGFMPARCVPARFPNGVSEGRWRALSGRISAGCNVAIHSLSSRQVCAVRCAGRSDMDTAEETTMAKAPNKTTTRRAAGKATPRKSAANKTPARRSAARKAPGNATPAAVTRATKAADTAKKAVEAETKRLDAARKKAATLQRRRRTPRARRMPPR